MKLVVVTSRIPWPLDKGDKLRIYYQIKYLSEYNEIYLISLNDSQEHPDAKLELSKYCKEIHLFSLTKKERFFGLLSSLFNGKPFQVGYFYNRKTVDEIQILINKINPDFIYGQLVRVVEYIKKSNFPKTLDLQDALSAGLLRRSQKSNFVYKLILKTEYKRMKKYEESVFETFDNLTIITEYDKKLLNTKYLDKIKVIPNGVDLEYFKANKNDKIFDIIFVGNMNYPPNILAAKYLVKEIMPIVWNKQPNFKVLLAGVNPHFSVQKLANNNVKIGGHFDDIREAYSSAKMFIAPMQIGTGLQNKLLEAMAMNIPCITSDLANNALQAINGTDILVAQKDDKQAFANHILKLYTDIEFAKTIANNGNLFVNKNHNWKSIISILNNCIKYENN